MENIDSTSGLIDDSSMEKKPLPSFWPTAYKYGFLAALFSIILTLVFDLLGMNEPGSSMSGTNIISSLLGFAVLAIFIILAIQQQRDQLQGGEILLGRAFMTGFATSLVLSLIMLFFMYVYFAFVNTGFREVLEAQFIIGMEDSGMSDSDINTALRIASIFWSPPALAVFGALSLVVQGAIVSLIAGAILKRSN